MHSFVLLQPPLSSESRSTVRLSAVEELQRRTADRFPTAHTVHLPSMWTLLQRKYLMERPPLLSACFIASWEIRNWLIGSSRSSGGVSGCARTHSALRYSRSKAATNYPNCPAKLSCVQTNVKHGQVSTCTSLRARQSACQWWKKSRMKRETQFYNTF